MVDDPAQALALWKIREDGAGLAGVSLARAAYPGWEDAAVPPEHLGAYLRDFDALLADHGLDGLPYGHFGDGCVHVRIDFPLTQPGGAAGYRAFVEQAAELVAGYGGSMSGEHGDGRARSALLPSMYSPAALSPLRPGQGGLRPAEPAQPGRPGRPAAGRRRSSRRGAGRPGRPLRRGRAPVQRRRQMPGRHHGRARRDVSLVPGDPGGEGLHPRAAPGCCRR